MQLMWLPMPGSRLRIVGAIAVAAMLASVPVSAVSLLQMDKLRQPAPNLGLDSGKTLADYRGQWVLLHFWATWCGPCARELPSLDRLRQRWQEKIDFFAIAIDEADAGIAPFLRDHDVAMLPLHAGRSGATARYWGWGVPVTYLVNPDGNIVARALGPREWDSGAGDATLAHFAKTSP